LKASIIKKDQKYFTLNAKMNKEVQQEKIN